MPRIFINYRREDSADAAGRLCDRLLAHFPDQVFMDIDSIEPGIDFVEVIEREVGTCDVVLALIGRHWLSVTDEQGAARLDNPGDFVRLELATALARNIRVIPVVVQGAAVPRVTELPSDLAPLARRNAIELRHERYQSDVDRLIEFLRRLEERQRETAPARTVPPEATAPTPHPPDRAARTQELNFFVALALDPNASWSREEILGELASKRREWTRLSKSPSDRGHEAKRMLGRTKDLERRVENAFDDKELLNRLQRDAQYQAAGEYEEQRYALTERLKLLEARGYVLQSELEHLATAFPAVAASGPPSVG